MFDDEAEVRRERAAKRAAEDSERLKGARLHDCGSMSILSQAAPRTVFLHDCRVPRTAPQLPSSELIVVCIYNLSLNVLPSAECRFAHDPSKPSTMLQCLNATGMPGSLADMTALCD